MFRSIRQRRASLRMGAALPADADRPIEDRPLHEARALPIAEDARVDLLVDARHGRDEVRAAFDGEQTLNLLRIERPDLLLLESGLDKIDGLEMIKRLRKQGGGRINLPVLFLNSSGDDNASREALALGARKVLTQPYDPGDVLASVREAVCNQ